MKIKEVDTMEEFERCLEVLNSAFDKEEMRTDEMFKELFQRHATVAYELLDEDSIVSCIIAWKFKEYLFLENFATKKEYREKGHGGKLLEAMKEFDLPIYLEIEEPNTPLRIRRMHFYERHGFTMNNVEYYLPPLQEGNPVLPYKIMSYKEGVDKEKIHRFYQEVYNSNKTVEEYRNIYNSSL